MAFPHAIRSEKVEEVQGRIAWRPLIRQRPPRRSALCGPALAERGDAMSAA